MNKTLITITAVIAGLATVAAYSLTARSSAHHVRVSRVVTRSSTMHNPPSSTTINPTETIGSLSNIEMQSSVATLSLSLNLPATALHGFTPISVQSIAMQVSRGAIVSNYNPQTGAVTLQDSNGDTSTYTPTTSGSDNGGDSRGNSEGNDNTVGDSGNNIGSSNLENNGNSTITPPPTNAVVSSNNSNQTDNSNMHTDLSCIARADNCAKN